MQRQSPMNTHPKIMQRLLLEKIGLESKKQGKYFCLYVWRSDGTCSGDGNVSVYGSHREREYLYDSDRNDDWFHWHSRY